MTAQLPCLYSFRRCPYAMRARLAILFAGVAVELREVVLKNKPAPMLAISPKGTVPVVQLPDGGVIEESLDIMLWALGQHDKEGLLEPAVLQQAHGLIKQNDEEFKHWLDRYKYFERHVEMTQIEYRKRGEDFLQVLEKLLGENKYLLADKPTLADIAIMPFVRQFAHVDRELFYNLPYPNLQRWLQDWLEHALFLKAMVKFAPWQEGDDVVIFP